MAIFCSELPTIHIYMLFVNNYTITKSGAFSLPKCILYLGINTSVISTQLHVKCASHVSMSLRMELEIRRLKTIKILTY
jgi:hypothetical protein